MPDNTDANLNRPIRDLDADSMPSSLKFTKVDCTQLLVGSRVATGSEVYEIVDITSSGRHFLVMKAGQSTRVNPAPVQLFARFEGITYLKVTE